MGLHGSAWSARDRMQQQCCPHAGPCHPTLAHPPLLPHPPFAATTGLCAPSHTEGRRRAGGTPASTPTSPKPAQAASGCVRVAAWVHAARSRAGRGGNQRGSMQPMLHDTGCMRGHARRARACMDCRLSTQALTALLPSTHLMHDTQGDVCPAGENCPYAHQLFGEC